MICSTTRRHPRTLADAFPDVRATWHEGWQRRSERMASVLLAIGIGVALALVLVSWIDWSLA